jgi:hypothetical protein
MAPPDLASPPLDRASHPPNRAGNFHPVEKINAFSRIQPKKSTLFHGSSRAGASMEVEHSKEKE